MMKSLLLFLSIFSACHSIMFAQVEVIQEKKFEHDGPFSVAVTADHKIVFSSIFSEKGKNEQLEIVAFDENFKELGKFQGDCPEKTIYKTSSLSGNGDFFFSVVIDKNKTIHSTTFDVNTFETKELKVELEKKFEPNGNLDFLGGTSTMCFKNKFFILGTVKNVPCLLVYNMFTGTQHLTFIPGMDKKMRVSFLSTDESAPSIQIMYYNYKSKKIENQYIASINEFGELEGSPIAIAAQKGKLLIDGNVTWTNESSFLLCGATGESSSMAQGMYIIEIRDGSVIRRSDFDFNEFNNFYSLLNQKSQRRIERKKNRKKNFESQCYMVTHPVAFSENTWTVVGEVFYPTYRTEYRTTYVNGRPVTQTVYVFDGYAYSHAVVLQVSPELEKIRDYVFNLDIYEKPFFPKKFVRIAQSKDKLNFYYASSNSFGHVSLENGGLTESPTLTLFKKDEDLDEEDKLLSYGSAGAVYWFDDFYLISDSYRIKDRNNDDGKRRKSFVQFKKIKIIDA